MAQGTHITTWMELLGVAVSVLFAGGAVAIIRAFGELSKLRAEAAATREQAEAAASKTDLERAAELIAALQSDNNRLREQMRQIEAHYEERCRAYEVRIDELQHEVDRLCGIMRACGIDPQCPPPPKRKRSTKPTGETA